MPYMPPRSSRLPVIVCLALSAVLLIVPITPLVRRDVKAQSREQSRSGKPKPGVPAGTVPDLDQIRSRDHSFTGPRQAVPSTVRPAKRPLSPGARPRLKDVTRPRQASGAVATTTIKKQRTSRASHHVSLRTPVPAWTQCNYQIPSPLDDDWYVQNFIGCVLNRAAMTDELTYWEDVLRAAHANSTESVKMAVRELGKTLFESTEYTARARNDHDFVGDLYRAYLMREPDSTGWSYWEALVDDYGRAGVRRNFDESTEFYTTLATVTQYGTATSAATSLVAARVEGINQPGSGLLGRDANWSLSLLKLPGRAGLDLGLTLSYSSMVWTRSGPTSRPYIYFDEDNGSPAPGFRLGFPTIQERFFDARMGANVFLLLTPAGQRVVLRQAGTGATYESLDSSYLQLIDNGSSLLVRSTDGMQLTYTSLADEWRCTQIEDRNGNYLTVQYNDQGQIEFIRDTLWHADGDSNPNNDERQLRFQYDTNDNLLVINQYQGGTLNTWVTFGWGVKTFQSSFSGAEVVGIANNTTIPVLTDVNLNDNSYYQFAYTNSLQVSSITSNRGESPLSITEFSYDSPTSECPRLTESSVWARNWSGIEGVPESVATQYEVMPDGAHQMTRPDGTVYKEYYGTGWQKGLTRLSEVWVGGVKQKWTTTTLHQDNETVDYLTNPRVTETTVQDASNLRRTELGYASITLSTGTTAKLPDEIKEYQADGTTVYRRTLIEYLAPGTTYLNSNVYLIGLPELVTVRDGGNNLISKTRYAYDWTGEYLVDTSATPTQHDSNYGVSFSAGRGNLSKVVQYDIEDPDNETKGHANKFAYDINGSVVFTRDALDHQTTISYDDSFSQGGDRHTFAFPTKVKDPDWNAVTAPDNYSTVQYSYDYGLPTRTEGPPPAGQSQGRVQTMLYDQAMRLQRVTTTNNSAYIRYLYGEDYTLSYSTINNVADERIAIQVFDGLGRTRFSTQNHPGSVGGYRTVHNKYNVVGRLVASSNPTEINASYVPKGDDVAGWLYTLQSYDWKGRPLITTNPDETTKEASYAGCGCAGGEVVTLTDEGTLDNGVAKRRQQKIYADVFGRTVKTEVLNWQGGSAYSTTVNTYNARDQVTQVRQWAGAENGAGAYQDTTMTYDGYGRLKTTHLPEQDSGTNTSLTYNADDTVNTVTDARNVIASYSYNARHMLSSSSYSAPSGITATASVTYGYDAAGNRTSMTDGPGSVAYNHDELSRLSSETRTFTGLGSYAISYQYNLANQLKSITDPANANAKIEYGFSSAGQLKTVTGVNYSTATFVSDVKYRAWGTPKQVSFGNGRQLSVSYDSRLQPDHLELGGASLPLVMAVDYERYDDGRVKYSENLIDARFDRAFKYDHSDRLTRGLSGAEARDEIADGDRPYNEGFGYDEFGHITNRTTRHWSRQAPFLSVDSYVNNRRTEWQYDAAGNLTDNNSREYTIDAAGRTVLVSGSNLSQSYDGNGQRIKTTEADLDTYYVRSTALGGKVVAELDESGVKQLGLIYQGSEILAEQYQDGSIALLHKDVSNLSVRRTDAQSGTVSGANELDPLEADTEMEDPYPDEPDYQGRGEGGPLYPAYGNIAFPTDGCTLDGVYFPCEMAMRALQSGAADQCSQGCGPLVVDVYVRGKDKTGKPAEQTITGFIIPQSTIAGGLWEGINGTWTGAAARQMAGAFDVGATLGGFEVGVMRAAITGALVQLGAFGDGVGNGFAQQKAVPVPTRPQYPPNEKTLSDCVKSRLRPYFKNVNLDDLRIHEGIPGYVAGNPRAYTNGNDIYFKEGLYDPHSLSGLAEIGHEITHSDQYAKLGATNFRAQYLGEYFIQRQLGLDEQSAYENISFEIEARAKQELIYRDLKNATRDFGGKDPCPR